MKELELHPGVRVEFEAGEQVTLWVRPPAYPEILPDFIVDDDGQVMPRCIVRGED